MCTDMGVFVCGQTFFIPLPPGLTEEMDNDGYHNIVNIDSSKVVIENMKETYKERTTISWQIMNCTAMDFKDGAFEAIVDKGTLDSILCGEGTLVFAFPWTPSRLWFFDITPVLSLLCSTGGEPKYFEP
jgi:hypothetical protein